MKNELIKDLNDLQYGDYINVSQNNDSRALVKNYIHCLFIQIFDDIFSFLFRDKLGAFIVINKPVIFIQNNCEVYRIPREADAKEIRQLKENKSILEAQLNTCQNKYAAEISQITNDSNTKCIVLKEELIKSKNDITKLENDNKKLTELLAERVFKLNQDIVSLTDTIKAEKKKSHYYQAILKAISEYKEV